MSSFMSFLKTMTTSMLLKAMEIFKKMLMLMEKAMKNVLEKTKSKMKDKKMMAVMLVALMIFTMSWVILPYMVLLLFDLKSSSMIYDPDSFFKYSMMSMPFFFFIRGFMSSKVLELVDNHGSYGMLWLLSTMMVVWLLYYFMGWW